MPPHTTNSPNRGMTLAISFTVASSHIEGSSTTFVRNTAVVSGPPPPLCQERNLLSPLLLSAHLLTHNTWLTNRNAYAYLEARGSVLLPLRLRASRALRLAEPRARTQRMTRRPMTMTPEKPRA